MSEYKLDPFNALEAKTEAQKLSFAPIVFHTARTLRDLGILKALDDVGSDGLPAETISEITGVSEYGVKVLLDMALSAHIVVWEKPNYKIANLGFYLLHDGMTNANMDFTADVCYAAMMHLTEAIEKLTQENFAMKRRIARKKEIENLPSLPAIIEIKNRREEFKKVQEKFEIMILT